MIHDFWLIERERNIQVDEERFCGETWYLYSVCSLAFYSSFCLHQKKIAYTISKERNDDCVLKARSRRLKNFFASKRKWKEIGKNNFRGIFEKKIKGEDLPSFFVADASTEKAASHRIVAAHLKFTRPHKSQHSYTWTNMPFKVHRNTFHILT